jgi:hypothetical protein
MRSAKKGFSWSGKWKAKAIEFQHVNNGFDHRSSRLRYIVCPTLFILRLPLLPRLLLRLLLRPRLPLPLRPRRPVVAHLLHSLTDVQAPAKQRTSKVSTSEQAKDKSPLTAAKARSPKPSRGREQLVEESRMHRDVPRYCCVLCRSVSDEGLSQQCRDEGLQLEIRRPLRCGTVRPLVVADRPLHCLLADLQRVGGGDDAQGVEDRHHVNADRVHHMIYLYT